jgi:hypothetical protein
MTYGHAAEVIEAGRELLNYHAIETMKLEEGKVREWQGSYYYIVKIYGNASQYKILVQEVRLTRARGASQASMTSVGNQAIMEPSEMLYLSAPVDLTSWTDTSSPSSSTEEFPS